MSSDIKAKFDSIQRISTAADTYLQFYNGNARLLQGFMREVESQKIILEKSRNNRKETGGTALDTIIAKFFKAIEKVLNTFGSSLVTGKRTTNKLFDVIKKHGKAQDQSQAYKAKQGSKKGRGGINRPPVRRRPK